MKIILTISRFLAVVSSVIVGSLAIVVGENDDSPGLQGLGCILIISTLVVTLFGRIQQKSQTKFAMQPIGLVKSSRKEVVDDNWGAETSKIVLEDSISIDALTGLETFSHCLVVYFFDQASSKKIEMLRHPRGNTAWPKVGIFAQRAKDRPNRLGVTVCRVLKIDRRDIFLEGLDAVDGTPVLDIKPWMAEFGPQGEVFQPQWSQELMKNYW